MNDKPRRAIPIPTPPAPRVVAHVAPPVVQRHVATSPPRHHAPPPPAWPHRPIQAKPAAPAIPTRPGPPPPAFAVKPATVQAMWSQIIQADPKPKAQIAEMRTAACLKPPGQAQTVKLSTLWSWVKDNASLSYEAVADTEQEIATVRGNLSLLLGAGAQVIIGPSSRILATNTVEVVSAVAADYDACADDMAQRWTDFATAFSDNVATARASHTTIHAYLTAKGFGPQSQNGNTRVKDLGGGYHATFSVFANADAAEEVSTARRLYQAGNMHITYEKLGQDNPKNPRYYCGSGFQWASGWAAVEEDERQIRGALREASETVKVWCGKLLTELEANKKKKK